MDNGRKCRVWSSSLDSKSLYSDSQGYASRHLSALVDYGSRQNCMTLSSLISGRQAGKLQRADSLEPCSDSTCRIYSSGSPMIPNTSNEKPELINV